MKSLIATTFVALATLANAAVIKRASPLAVTLSASGHEVTATIQNVGSTSLKMLRLGTLLDDQDPVQKLHVSKGGFRSAFQGMTIYPAYSALVPSSFTQLHANQTMTITLDPSELHDLSSGGDYDLIAEGSIPLADAGSLTLNGQHIAYKSNILTLPVNPAHARLARAAFLARRATPNANCQGDRLNLLTGALSECSVQAAAAANAASTGSPAGKFKEYFKVTYDVSGGAVADRFSAIASACESNSAVDLDCDSNQGPCLDGAGAWASGDHVVFCDYWFNDIPTTTDQCHAPDRAGILIHELTHVGSIYPPSTDDFAYGYENSMALGAEQAINNADTFALYANAIAIGGGC